MDSNQELLVKAMQKAMFQALSEMDPEDVKCLSLFSDDPYGDIAEE